MVLGICGKYCSGKSEAARILGDEGWQVIDADALGHETLDEHSQAVAAAFGRDILNPDGKVNRRKLGSIVFKNSAKLKTLEAIVHPPVKEKIREILAGAKGRILIHAALLYGGGVDEICDRILIIEAPLLDRINRGLSRDNLSITAVLRRIWKQRSLYPQSALKAADTITVRNSGSKGSLREAVLAATASFKE